MPGSPPSASTARPESSASAGRPEAVAAATRLQRGVRLEGRAGLLRLGQAELAGRDRPSARRARPARSISRTLPALWVATTSLSPRSSDARHRRRQRIASFCSSTSWRDAAAGERRAARANSASLNGAPSAVPWISTMPPDAGHDEIGVGLGLDVLGIVEVEHRRAAEDAAGDRGDVVARARLR